MKHFSSYLLVLLLIFSFSGCRNSSRSASPSSVVSTPDTSPVSSTPSISASDAIPAASTSISDEENWELIAEYFLANFPNNIMTVSADVDRDGLADCIFVDDKTDEYARYGYVLTVKDGKVQSYLLKEGGETHLQGFFCWYLDYDEDGNAFFIEYDSAMWQGVGTLSLASYFLDENGSRMRLDEYTVGDENGHNEPSGLMKNSVYNDFFTEGARWLDHALVLHHAGPWEFGDNVSVSYSQVSATPYDEVEFEEEERRNITNSGLIDVDFTDMENPVDVLNGKYQILFPLSWRDRYVVKFHGAEPTWWGEYVTIYSKKSYDNEKDSGLLCSIEFTYMMDLQGMESSDTDWLEIGSWEKGFVILTKPDDVQFDSAVAGLSEEYGNLSKEVNNVVVVEAPTNQMPVRSTSTERDHEDKTNRHDVTENDN